MLMILAQAAPVAGNYAYFKLIPLILGSLLVYSLITKPEAYIHGRAGRFGRITRFLFDTIGEENSKKVIRFILAPFTIVVLIYYIVLPLLGLR